MIKMRDTNDGRPEEDELAVCGRKRDMTDHFGSVIPEEENHARGLVKCSTPDPSTVGFGKFTEMDSMRYCMEMV